MRTLSKRKTSELRRLHEANGVLRPEAVVKSARSKSSPLHGEFEWDDSIAGRKYRLDQARSLIRMAVVVIENVREPVRAYVSLSNDRVTRDGGYRDIETVMDNEVWRNLLLDQARRDAEMYASKYQALQELAGIFVAMRRTFPKPRKRKR